ncbi:MAG TPA: peptide MFS transporter [Ideonella sp.]|uniref:peptide MFS transporter n=1 Tax=Ideonella sp. TaxID=1929293 RepID=UPI002E2F2440|nr:peptide MFS transporter [Ideonella sp.]HEX5687098.1 peptide MFS transporter [Ideonella sp.]
MNTTALPLITADASGARHRHPPGLKIIFMTEMWERFSYYGMRALLVLYLVNAMGYARADALQIYGLYTGLVYITPLIGGAMADRWLGARLAAVIGAAIMMLGHFAMAVPSMLPLALGLLIVGNGFFKANTTAMVGMLYPDANDPRRAAGYTYFYMGVNLGGFIAPIAVGTLGQLVGWHWGFASAGVGMAIGMAVLCWGQRWLGNAGLRDQQAPVSWQNAPLVLAFCVASVGLVLAVLAVAPWVGALWRPLPAAVKTIGWLVLLGLCAWAALRGPDGRLMRFTRPEIGRVVAIGIVALFVIFFWMGFEQTGGTMTLFADKQTDRHLAGWEIPAAWFLSINPLGILLLAPVFAWLWTTLDSSRFALPDTAKQALGMVVLGLGFVVMAMAQTRADQLGAVGPQWLAAVYLLHTIGELMLSPVGLSLVSRAAPARLVSLLMGVWLMAIGVANYLAGALEGLLAGSGIALYVFLSGISIGAGVLLLALTPWLQRLLSSRD